ncbi:MAG: hypothetical protein ACJ75J_14965 [Cytophagaceae bacterium]
MLRKINLFFFACFALFSASVAQSSDPIQKDLLNYINVELTKVALLETRAVDTFESVSGKNYKGDSIMYVALKDVVLPNYSELYKKLQGIHPATKELKKIHGEYIKAAKYQLEAFNLIVDAIKKQDAKEIQKANKDLKEAISLVADWKKKLLDLCDRHNVVLGKGE